MKKTLVLTLLTACILTIKADEVIALKIAKNTNEELKELNVKAHPKFDTIQAFPISEEGKACIAFTSYKSVSHDKDTQDKFIAIAVASVGKSIQKTPEDKLGEIFFLDETTSKNKITVSIPLTEIQRAWKDFDSKQKSIKEVVKTLKNKKEIKSQEKKSPSFQKTWVIALQTHLGISEGEAIESLKTIKATRTKALADMSKGKILKSEEFMAFHRMGINIDTMRKDPDQLAIVVIQKMEVFKDRAESPKKHAEVIFGKTGPKILYSKNKKNIIKFLYNHEIYEKNPI